jgi:shikimate kinase
VIEPGTVGGERPVIELGRPHLALAGLPGAGKSALAPLVARRFGVPAVDLDRAIEARVGLPVPELVARDEADFRVLEGEVLEDLLAAGAPRVVALGGGAVLAAANRAALRRRATVAWLACAPAVLAARLSGAGATARPLLAGDLQDALRRLGAAREAVYEEVADLVVDAAQPLGVVADTLVEALRVRGWGASLVAPAPGVVEATARP